MRSKTAAAFRRLSVLVALVPAVALSQTDTGPSINPCLFQDMPVTVAEANAVFDKVDAAIRKILKMPLAQGSTDRADRAVTRAEVVAKLDSLFEAYRPKFAYTPRPFRTEPAAVASRNKDRSTIDKVNKLARWGCLAPVGPVAVGPSDTLTTREFGDAVGYFMSQIAALTYYADPKWVPTIMPPG